MTPRLPRDVTKVFISLVTLYKPVKSTAITQWLHEILGLRVLRWAICYGHSILKCIDLSSSWCRYYYWRQQAGVRALPLGNSTTAQSMIHPLVDHDQYLPRPLHELLAHAQLHPNKPSASYKQHHWYVRLNLLKYNFQMAQIMQWLHASWNYMKRVKSSISTVLPTHMHPSNKSLLSYWVTWLCILGDLALA